MEQELPKNKENKVWLEARLAKLGGLAAQTYVGWEFNRPPEKPETQNVSPPTSD